MKKRKQPNLPGGMIAMWVFAFLQSLLLAYAFSNNGLGESMNDYRTWLRELYLTAIIVFIIIYWLTSVAPQLKVATVISQFNMYQSYLYLLKVLGLDIVRAYSIASISFPFWVLVYVHMSRTYSSDLATYYLILGTASLFYGVLGILTDMKKRDVGNLVNLNDALNHSLEHVVLNRYRKDNRFSEYRQSDKVFMAKTQSLSIAKAYNELLLEMDVAEKWLEQNAKDECLADKIKET